MTDPDAWERWKNLVLEGIKKLEGDLKTANDAINDLKLQLAILKTETSQAARSSGALSGFLSAVAALILALAIAVVSGKWH
jgi:hypothetical protein